MTDYVRAVWEQAKSDIRSVMLFVLAALALFGSAVTLIRGDAFWASLALFAGSALFITLCVYLIRMDVRRARTERTQPSRGSASG